MVSRSTQNSCRLLFLSILLFLVPGIATAQAVPYATLTGTVRDQETGEPLEGAHVFIAVSMIGTVTGPEGTYTLENVPLGAHRLYVSMLGYESEGRDLLLREGGAHAYAFELKPGVLEGPEVTVTAEHDERWRERLEKFIGLFIGETPNAQQTEILNPFVLDFEQKLHRFTARASEPLVIENKALGYRIQYFLEEFVAEGPVTLYDGEPLYEEMEADSPEQAAMWEANRKAAYYGSIRHFLRALATGTTEEEGFLTYNRPAERNNLMAGPFGGLPAPAAAAGPRFPIEPEKIFKKGKSDVERRLDFHGYIDVIYTRETEDPSYYTWTGRRPAANDKFQTSWIELLRGPAVFDYKGDIADPRDIMIHGYWAFDRVADEVPKEFMLEPAL